MKRYISPTDLHLQKSMQPVEYYNKLPERCSIDTAIILDPMIATGGTALAAISILAEWGVKKCIVLAAVASRQGVDAISSCKSDGQVRVVVGAMDELLDDRAYIIPGLGDIGDRMFGAGY